MTTDLLRFGEFELNRSAYQLRRAGDIVRLERLPMELLLLLVERRGQLVTRNEILERLWGANVVRDVDHSINTAIRKIRLVLRDDPENPRLLHTVPGKGYRFAAEERVADTMNGGHSPLIVPSPVAANFVPRDPEIVAPPVVIRRRWQVVLATAASVLIALFLGWRYLARDNAPNDNKVMLVVLPFANLSGDPSQEYFADGMTEELIAQLGGLDPDHLGVIARTSAMQYKGTHKNVAQIGRELGVRFLVESSVRRSGGRLRITAQLIATDDQAHLWAGTFDRDVSDVLRLQSDLSLAIANKIKLALPQHSAARLARAPSVNPQAYEAYLEGLQAWNLRTKAGFERAISEFNRAILLEPNNALAYAALARTYSLAPVVGLGATTESMYQARELASRALILDDSVASAHSTLGFVYSHYDYNWTAAEREFLRAIALNPSDAYAHLFFSNSYLSPRGRHDQAIAEMNTAIKLDPLSAPIDSFLGRTYISARRYKDAITHLQHSVEHFPSFGLNHQRLADAYRYVGRFDAAIAEETLAAQAAGWDAHETVHHEDVLRAALAARGPRGYWEATEKFALGDFHPPESLGGFYGRAMILTELGETDMALELLERGLQEHSFSMMEMGVEPAFDALRANSRFQVLMRHMGLTL